MIMGQPESGSGSRRKRSSSSGSARLPPAPKKTGATESDSGGAGGILNKVAVEVTVPETGSQVMEEGGRERSDSSSSDSSLSSSSNNDGSPTSGGVGGQLNKVAVEVMVPGGRRVPEAGAGPPEAVRQVLKEGGMERAASSSNDSSLSSSSNISGSPTSRGVGGQSNKVLVEQVVAKVPEISRGSKNHSFSHYKSTPRLKLARVQPYKPWVRPVHPAEPPLKPGLR